MLFQEFLVIFATFPFWIVISRIFFLFSFQENNDKWSLKVRKRSGESLTTDETKNKIEAYLKQLRKNIPDSELVLCVFYTSYVNYIHNQILVKWSNEFSGWCDLYTVMSEKLHKRNLVIKAPFGKSIILNVCPKKLGLVLDKIIP